MIDEEKILREIEEIKEQYEESSPEKKLLDGFAEYIRMQEKVDIRELMFISRVSDIVVKIVETEKRHAGN